MEIIAPNVEEAINNGLTELGLPRQAVEIEVLDEGSHGLFGLGARQARVRLTILSQYQDEQINQELKLTELSIQEFDIHPREQEEIEIPSQVPLDKNKILQVSQSVVQELLMKMGIVAQVTTSFAENVDNRGRLPVKTDIHGQDLSILIGRNAEILNALQYISSLIISKELEQTISLQLDVEGYRQRREMQLRQLARRMAEQAVKTGRRQILEPMPANERRLIHLELREHPEVHTESVGEEPHRKVTIIPT